MKSYLVKTPKLVSRLFPKRLWAFANKKNTVFLTFDDGPIPEVTPWVLQQLKKYNAKATFFCIGDNVMKHPNVFKQVIKDEHGIGNHTFNHINGWKNATQTYIQNIEKFEKEVPIKTILFRPPYGKITSNQAKKLTERGYKIVMWDVLSADFDTSISKEKCVSNVLNNIEEGSIVVFHDSLKSFKKLNYVLPIVLEYISKKGWQCEAIR